MSLVIALTATSAGLTSLKEKRERERITIFLATFLKNQDFPNIIMLLWRFNGLS